MKSIDEHIVDLINDEQLNDFDSLITPRELDEVPFVSRLSRIGFLNSLDVEAKSRVLVVNAVKYLDRLLNFIKTARRTDVLAMVSVVNWEDLVADQPDPVIPNFWICTNVQRDLATFRLKPAASDEARLVSSWLIAETLLQDHEVFDAAHVVTDPELRRVYVARRNCRLIEQLVER